MNEPTKIPTLKETITGADQLFSYCRRTCAHPNCQDFPSLALYRHMIHMADGVEILSTAKALLAILPLLRSMLECFLALEYIHQQDYEQRSLAWLCAYIHQEIDIRETIDPSTEKGKQFQKEAEKAQRYWTDTLLKPGSSLCTQTANLRMALNTETFSKVEAEYQRLKQKSGKAKWFQMFEGPQNVFQMARVTGWLAFYSIFYKPWSAAVHGTDAGSLGQELVDGTVEFKNLRFEDGLQYEVDGAKILLAKASERMARKFGNSGSNSGFLRSSTQ